MKVIDLMNKIANGEEFPKKFKYNDKIYIYASDDFSVDDRREEWFIEDYANNAYLYEFLNEEIEIIEKEKEIEKLRLYYVVPNSVIGEDRDKIYDTLCSIIENQRTHEDKINEIIDKLEKMEENK